MRCVSRPICSVKINDFIITDTTGGFSTSLNRYTVSVAGTYQINACLRGISTNTGQLAITLYKNGGVYQRGGEVTVSGSASSQVIGSWFITLAASDYIEVWGYVDGTLPKADYIDPQTCCWMQGYYIGS